MSWRAKRHNVPPIRRRKHTLLLLVRRLPAPDTTSSKRRAPAAGWERAAQRKSANLFHQTPPFPMPAPRIPGRSRGPFSADRLLIGHRHAFLPAKLSPICVSHSVPRQRALRLLAPRLALECVQMEKKLSRERAALVGPPAALCLRAPDASSHRVV